MRRAALFCLHRRVIPWRGHHLRHPRRPRHHPTRHRLRCRGRQRMQSRAQKRRRLRRRVQVRRPWRRRRRRVRLRRRRRRLGRRRKRLRRQVRKRGRLRGRLRGRWLCLRGRRRRPGASWRPRCCEHCLGLQAAALLSFLLPLVAPFATRPLLAVDVYKKHVALFTEHVLLLRLEDNFVKVWPRRGAQFFLLIFFERGPSGPLIPWELEVRQARATLRRW